MPNKLEGKDVSLWVETTKPTSYPSLGSDKKQADVVVVGGGITGVVSAYLLQKAGLKTILLEKNRLVEWTTGGTTAKLTAQHYLIYDYLIKRHGKTAAQAFADANQRGIDQIENLSDELRIDCDFSRRSAYVYTDKAAQVGSLKSEVEAAQALGLPASFETEIDLPFATKGAVKFSNQAQFHPRKFLLPLAEEFMAAGGEIYEETEAKDIKPGKPNVVKTDQADIETEFVVQASGEPFWQGDQLSDFMWLKMSYALGVSLREPSDYPSGMYITTDEPMRTIRSAEYQNGKILIFGGESHPFDEENFDADSRYEKLIDDVKKRYRVDKVLFRWLAGDYMPYDRMPYIGPMPEQPKVLAVTGYRAWGLAWAMSAAEAIVGDITGHPVDWVKPFRFDRLTKPLLESDKTTSI